VGRGLLLANHVVLNGNDVQSALLLEGPLGQFLDEFAVSIDRPETMKKKV
jgi:hypothetical protein